MILHEFVHRLLAFFFGTPETRNGTNVRILSFATTSVLDIEHRLMISDSAIGNWRKIFVVDKTKVTNGKINPR